MVSLVFSQKAIGEQLRVSEQSVHARREQHRTASETWIPIVTVYTLSRASGVPVNFFPVYNFIEQTHR